MTALTATRKKGREGGETMLHVVCGVVDWNRFDRQEVNALDNATLRAYQTATAELMLHTSSSIYQRSHRLY